MAWQPVISFYTIVPVNLFQKSPAVNMRFSAIIDKIGINPVVDPPDVVLRAVFEQAGTSNGPIPVRGTINDFKFVQTLVKYKGSWRLYINGMMLKGSGSSVGDMPEIDLEFDPTPREISIPAALSQALEANQTAREAFQSLTPSRRKEICRYISTLKSEPAISKNIDRVISQLTRPIK